MHEATYNERLNSVMAIAGCFTLPSSRAIVAIIITHYLSNTNHYLPMLPGGKVLDRESPIDLSVLTAITKFTVRGGGQSTSEGSQGWLHKH